MRAVAVHVTNRAADAVDDPDRDDGVEELGVPVGVGGRLRRGIQLPRLAAAADLAAGLGQVVQNGDQMRAGAGAIDQQRLGRSEEHTSELQSLMRISYDVFCLKKNTQQNVKSAQQHTGNDQYTSLKTRD